MLACLKSPPFLRRPSLAGAFDADHSLGSSFVGATIFFTHDRRHANCRRRQRQTQKMRTPTRERRTREGGRERCKQRCMLQLS